MTPVTLYHADNAGTLYLYAAGDVAVTYDGQTYEPATISHSRPESGGDASRGTVEIRMPRTTPLAWLYLTTILWRPTIVTIYELDAAGVATIAVRGRISGHRLDGDEVMLACESSWSTISQPGLRLRHTVQCPHALYGRGCWLNLEDWGIPVTCTAYADGVATFPEAAAQPDYWARGGLFRAPSGILYWVLDQVGDQVTIAETVDDLAAAITGAGWDLSWNLYWGGYAGILYPGCDRSLGTCWDKFANGLNHGGRPWLPETDAFGTALF